MLTSKQAQANQKRYGMNEIREKKKLSIPRVFLEQYKDFLVIILIVSAAISGLLGDIKSSIVILVVITMNAILGTVQTIKAEQSINSLAELSAPEATVFRDGEVNKIPASEVTMEDEVVLEAGDRVPADGRLLRCMDLKIDESMLTGESLPAEKTLDKAVIGNSLGDQTDRVFAGSFVTAGRGTFLVTGIGMQTEMGKIAGLLDEAAEKKSPLQKSLDEFGKKLSVVILVFCGILFGVSVWRGEGIADAFLFAVALAVAAIPEALSSIVTIVLSMGTGEMAKEHAIVRKLHAVEGLGRVSVICSDKTGTLTQNKMTVEACYADGKDMPLEYEKTRQLPEFQKLMIYSVLCKDAVCTEEKELGDPTETSLINMAAKAGIDAETVRRQNPRIGERPFDSTRKMMTTVHNIGAERVMIVKGAVDRMLPLMKKIARDGMEYKISESDRRKIEQQNQTYAENGLRVLAFGYRVLDSGSDLDENEEDNLVFLGMTAMMDPPREESKAAVQSCIEAGIRPVMITGDHKITAAAIAKRIGILQEGDLVCEGADIDGMSDEDLEEYVERVSVYARVAPEHKIRIVKAWQRKGNIVAMTGDGVNDAPALKQADVGVAMGITGTDVAKEAAAIVLADDNFATIIKAVERGRSIFENIRHSIGFLLSGNLGAILTVLYASLAGLPVPFAPVHLLFINLLTDSLPAIALGLEPQDPASMKMKPEKRSNSLLEGKNLLKIGVEGLCIGVMTSVAFTIGLGENTTGTGNVILAKTLAFGTLCLGRLVHGYNCKSDHTVIFTKRFWNNPFLTGAFVLGSVMLLAVIYVPGLSGMFQTVSLNPKSLYREQLALCDDKIIDALVERNSIIEKIMAYKEEYGMSIIQPKQEEKQERQLEIKLDGNKYSEEIEDVFRRIRRNSKRIQARKLFDYNIVLIGFMGAGKSTISDYLSTVFDMEIVEMDQLIADREEMSIPDIFATYGEEYFRNLETDLLIEMQDKKNVVISCGGGVAMRERNVEEMKKNGKVVLLTASPETIYERVKDNNDRPVLQGRKNVAGISELMEQRREKYEAAADIVVNTDDKDVLTICEELVQKLTRAEI